MVSHDERSGDSAKCELSLRGLWFESFSPSCLAAVACGAGTLPIVSIPEEIVITTVRDDVVDACRQCVAADIADAVVRLREELAGRSLPVAIVTSSAGRWP
jgi:hypothetical protein